MLVGVLTLVETHVKNGITVVNWTLVAVLVVAQVMMLPVESRLMRNENEKSYRERACCVCLFALMCRGGAGRSKSLALTRCWGLRRPHTESGSVRTTSVTSGKGATTDPRRHLLTGHAIVRAIVWCGVAQRW